ncbi:MAG: hypothetical protein A3H28_07995 [Acidobacteria bacterium RIFCSPLOWO2_02_FULL_61_28]|nr:MAG: hypothetical protein A3H28_07995 [Acidobacteria bacterium RIFCSPLOWO2_02_FULL_61_28]
MVEFVRAIPRLVIRNSEFGIRHSAPPSLTPEHFRQMLEQALAADPILARRVLQPLLGTVIPFAGGVGCSIEAAEIKAGTFGAASCQGNYSFMNSKVGIGTTTPTSALTFGNSTDNAISTDTADGSDNKRLVITGGGSHGSARGASIYLAGNERPEAGRLDLVAGDASGGHIDSYVGGLASPAVRMQYGGKVGIGTTTPQEKLTVQEGRILGQASGDVRNLRLNQLQGTLKRTAIAFEHQGVEQFLLGVDPATNNTRSFFLHDAVANLQRFLVDPNGNLGIGTASPAEKLDVAGNIKTSGNAAFGGTTVNNSLATGYVVVKVDSTYLATQQEVRGMDGFIRSAFTSSVDRDAATGAGWDRFGLGAGVEILPANKEYISGQQKGMASELYVDEPTAIDTWQANHAYALQKLVQPTTPNGRYYRVTVAGTSGSTQPTWPTTDGGTVSDGSVTWKETPLVEEMVDFQAYIEVDDKTSVGSWWGLIINGPNIGSAATPGKIRKGYGVYIQDLSEKPVITQAHAAAIKIDGLNEYGRILWNGSSIYETSSGHLEIDATNLGFYGTTPVAQQTVTGSKGGNVALANLLTALANLGLIVDGTS